MSNIESILTETRLFEAPQSIKQSVAINDDALAAMRAKASEDNVGFWSDFAKEKLSWTKPFTVGLDESKAPHYQWFTDGELHVSYNCIDRHLDTKANKTAIIFEGDEGDVERYTYKELHLNRSRH